MVLVHYLVPCLGFSSLVASTVGSDVQALEYRYSFNYDLSNGRSVQTAFEVKDAVQVLDTAYDKAKAATFDLQSRNVMLSDHELNAENRHPNLQVAIQLKRDPKLEPNTSDKKTIVNLAKMTSDAYLEDPSNPNWFNTSFGFNFTKRFGWKEEGLRGHIFATKDNRMAVVSFKGTTIYPRGKLSERDRVNDVSLFSCCCGAQHPYHYSPVCNCSTASYECNSDCLTAAILQNETYYDAAMFTMIWATAEFPRAHFWVVGHSLGGSIASMVGLSLNIPAVTFESPPERLPAQRMGLLSFDDFTRYSGVSAYHFGHSADPVFVGSCQGYLSTCSVAGFDFETQCHSGKRCLYDTVRDKGWHVNIANHRIDTVIPSVLEAYDTVANCTEVVDCTDCSQWKFS